MKNKNTICVKKSKLDQFYTSEATAQNCFAKVLQRYPEDKFSLFLEPSAGTGSFYKNFPIGKRLGLDIEPKYNGVEKQDFFKWNPLNNLIIATIGNPPFGKNASLAVKFFNKAAEFSEVIAFIVPKTFRKKSIQNRLNLYFKLKSDIVLPKNSFILNDKPYDVPCCFQIWERSGFKRKVLKNSLDNDFFDFAKKNDGDIAVRRVGGRTGKATLDIENSAEVSHYFLKLKDKDLINWLIDKINNTNFDKIINSTAGVKSISKYEFVSILLK